MATKKDVELKEETLEKSPVFVSNEKELLKKVILLEAENVLIPQLKQEIELLKKELLSVKKSNEEIINNEYDLKKHSDKLSIELNQCVIKLQDKEKEISTLTQIKDQQISALKNDLTKLANLFDEHIAAFQDQVKMLQVFVKNTQTVEKYLSGKIEEYNNGGNKK